MKNLILMRHGETTQIKSDPRRGLTPEGMLKVAKIAGLLKNQFKEKEFAIVLSATERARETGKILSKNMKITSVIERNMRILNLDHITDKIKQNEGKNIRPAKTYLSLDKKYLELNNVETPEELVIRWNNLIHEINKENVIIISHECSLEAYYYYQQSLKLVKKTFNKYFDYSDFAILTKLK